MWISAVCDCVVDVDTNTKSDGSVGRLVTVVAWQLLRHLHGKPHCSIDAIDKEGVAPGLHNPTAMFLGGRVDQFPAEPSQPFDRANIIEANMAAVACHVSVDDRDQLPSVWQVFGQVRWSGHRHR